MWFPVRLSWPCAPGYRTEYVWIDDSFEGSTWAFVERVAFELEIFDDGGGFDLDVYAAPLWSVPRGTLPLAQMRKLRISEIRALMKSVDWG